MHRLLALLLLSLLLSVNSHAQQAQTCATSLSELKSLLHEDTLGLKWEETTMDDGKPLIVSILEKNGALFVKFVKTQRGLWAETFGTICQTSTDLEMRFSADQIHFGDAASWVLRYVLGKGGQFTLTKLGSKSLRISTSGWSGDFRQIDK